jgi:hypothetical protein
MFNLDLIRRSTNLVHLVSQYLPLRKRTKDYVGSCPFHQDKGPSFKVTETYFKCFGCNKSGDCFSFLMAIENLTFIQAARRLCESAGIPIPETKPAEQKQIRQDSIYAKVIAQQAENWRIGYIEACELQFLENPDQLWLAPIIYKLRTPSVITFEMYRSAKQSNQAAEFEQDGEASRELVEQILDFIISCFSKSHTELV